MHKKLEKATDLLSTAIKDHHLIERGNVPGSILKLYFRNLETSDHWSSLIWSKGHLILVGDLGDLVLTHYSAFDTPENAFQWLQSEDAHYMLSKSSCEKVIDGEATKELLYSIKEDADSEEWDDLDKQKLLELIRDIEDEICNRGSNPSIVEMIYDCGLFESADLPVIYSYPEMVFYRLAMMRAISKNYMTSKT